MTGIPKKKHTYKLFKHIAIWEFLFRKPPTDRQFCYQWQRRHNYGYKISFINVKSIPSMEEDERVMNRKTQNDHGLPR